MSVITAAELSVIAKCTTIPVDLNKIAEAANISLYTITIDENDPKDCIGIIRITETEKSVYISDQLYNSDQSLARVVIAHMIAHIIYDHIDNKDEDYIETLDNVVSSIDGKELEATHYALDLLAPIRVIKKLAKNTFTMGSPSIIATHLKVPVDMVKRQIARTVNNILTVM